LSQKSLWLSHLKFEISNSSNIFHAIICAAERMAVTSGSLVAFDPLTKAPKTEFDELLLAIERDSMIVNCSKPQRKWKQIMESRQLSAEK
jgi:hypothetical protein